MNRSKKEWTTVATWASIHALVAACVLVVSSGHSSVANQETLSVGTVQTQLVSVQDPAAQSATSPQQQAAKQPQTHAEAKRIKPEPNRPMPNEYGIFPNEVESNPRPLAVLQPTQLEELAQQYSSVCSDNNIQISFVLGRVPIRKIGRHYLVKVSGDKQYVFDDRGQVSGEGVRFGAAIGLDRLPSVVNQYLNDNLSHFEQRSAMVVLSNDTEVAMHRSLRSFLRSRGIKTLVPNAKYSARMAIAHDGALLFDWSFHHLPRTNSSQSTPWRQ